MLIPEDKLEEIRAASDIVDVVGEYVELKRSGSSFKGLCPFHNENTPSFHVNPSMNIYKCFGCGEGGDVFNFIQQVENVGFVESARILAERAGIDLELEEGASEEASEREAVYSALRFAARFFYRQLTASSAGTQGPLEYLKDRGLTARTIKTFGLGYAPDGWQNLLDAADDEHVNPEILEKAGLIVPRKEGDGYYDRFRDRVIFPLFSVVGKVIGFAGRVLEPRENQPKYINSPETIVYQKSKSLYGLFQAKHEIRRQEEVLLVEGYTDVLSLFQAGIENVVATSGTALTREQIKILDRYADRIVLLYDADEAGVRAAFRAIDLALANGMVPNIVALPPGTDPDSYVREHGSDQFRELLAEHRADFVEYKIEHARETGKMDDPEQESTAIRSIIRSIAQMPDPLRQETYLKQTARSLEVPDTTLYRVLEQERKNRQRASSRRRSREERRGKKSRSTRVSTETGETNGASTDDPRPAEKLLLRLMLERGRPMVEFILSHMALDEFAPGPSRQIAEHLLEMYEEEAIRREPFVDGSLGKEVRAIAAEVLTDRHEMSDNWRQKGVTVPEPYEDAHRAAADAMTFMKQRRVRQLMMAHDEKIRKARERNEPVEPLLREKRELEELRFNIENREFLEFE
jgi:DNA primase